MARPSAIGKLEGDLGRSLDYRHELEELHTELISEVPVNIEWMVGVGGMDGAQHVEVDFV
ncbi:MAG: hypothetical protein GY926_19035 [bacterium]|nr:hypothetical protein [Actinomycetes bacterium]MCP4967312.1 hypothetical protein [bacterium]